MMMADVMEALGLGGKYVVKVNNRKVLDGVLASRRASRRTSRSSPCCAPSTSSTSSASRASTLLLGAGRKDESGDFTKGAGLSQAQIDPILALHSVAANSTPRRHTRQQRARRLRPSTTSLG